MVEDKQIILVNLPPSSNYQYDHAGCIYPATGLMLIGTILKKKGFFVELIDGAVISDYEQIVLDKVTSKTIFVAFSTMTSQVVMGRHLSKRIKEKWPRLITVFGGAHPTLYPQQTVEDPFIDVAVVNEGSSTILAVVDYIEGRVPIEKVNGIAFCDSKGKARINPPGLPDNIEDIPHFDFDLLDTSVYLNANTVYGRELDPSGKEELRLMPILTGLGCCFKCKFCINVILKRRYRVRSAASIVEEIKRLQSVYGANAFLFLDEDFCINKQRLADFIDLVKKENLKFFARIWTRVSYFQKESFKALVPEMERIGIRSIAMGAESGSQRMLDYISKGIKCEDIICAAEELVKTNITPRFSFIAGMDGERKEETIATYKLCADLLRINPRTDIAGPFTFRYYPGSPIFQEMVKKYNLKLPRSIEELEGALNDDGSLIVDSREWTWPGFFEYHESMSSYIKLYSHVLTKPGHPDSFFVKLIKKFLIWRLKTGEHGYIVDYHLLRSMKKIRKGLSGVKKHFLVKRVERDESNRDYSCEVKINKASQ